MSSTVTITRQGKSVPARRYTLEFSRLPGQTFGPYRFEEAIPQLRVAALLEPIEARNAVMDAAVNGSQTVGCNFDA